LLTAARQPSESQLESAFYEASSLDEVDLLRAKLGLSDQRQDIESRKKYGRLIFALIVAWLFVVLLTVWLSAIKIQSPSWWPTWLPSVTEFELSDLVLTALIGTTTANIVGLLYVVVRYIFPRRGTPADR
jgi:hypothetical protein